LQPESVPACSTVDPLAPSIPIQAAESEVDPGVQVATGTFQLPPMCVNVRPVAAYPAQGLPTLLAALLLTLIAVAGTLAFAEGRVLAPAPMIDPMMSAVAARTAIEVILVVEIAALLVMYPCSAQAEQVTQGR
jgi:hypothetical protein